MGTVLPISVGASAIRRVIKARLEQLPVPGWRTAVFVQCHRLLSNGRVQRHWHRLLAFSSSLLPSMLLLVSRAPHLERLHVDTVPPGTRNCRRFRLRLLNVRNAYCSAPARSVYNLNVDAAVVVYTVAW